MAILIAYYSRAGENYFGGSYRRIPVGNTRRVAEQLASLTGGDLLELEPAEPYTSADLDYNNADSRVSREHDDETLRDVALKTTTADNWADYDTVYIGYPIWWGTMPRIINTFVETHDLSGKVVLPFCTSGGSSISQSVSDLRQAAPKADVRDGLRISGSDEDSITQWLDKNHMTA